MPYSGRDWLTVSSPLAEGPSLGPGTHSTCEAPEPRRGCDFTQEIGYADALLGNTASKVKVWTYPKSFKI